MKKQLTLMTALMLFPFLTHAQLKRTIVESNNLLTEKEKTPGGMIFQAIKLPILKKHMLLTSFANYELVDGESIIRVLIGAGGVNASNTLAGGVMGGLKTNFNGATQFTSSFWCYLQNGRFSTTLIYIDWEAYLLEVSFRISEEDKRWHTCILLTNHGSNYGPALEKEDTKSKFYAYIGPTMQVYELEKQPTGETRVSMTASPMDHIGVHVGLGFKIGFSKN